MMTPARQGHLAMLSFSALVAGSFSLGSLVANQISPSALNAVRFWIAAAVIGAVALATGKLRRVHFTAPWRFAVLGGLFAIYFVLMFEGLKTAPPVSTAAVFTLTPMMAGLAGWVLLRQVMTPRMGLALTIGGIGAIWVIFQADWGALLRFQIGRGEFVFFWGCAAHAIYTPMVRRLNRGEPVIAFTFGTLVAGGVILTIWGWSDIRATNWVALPGIVWVTILYVAIVASAVTFVLVQFSTLRLPSSKVMAYTYLTPSWVAVWEYVLHGAVPPMLVLAGVGLTALALGMLLRD